AALGFAKKFGLSVGDLKTEDTPKGEYLYLTVEEGGGETAEILKNILPGIITDIPFPKAMRWGAGETRFARPIRSIVSIFGKTEITFAVEGLKSGVRAFGHRFNGKPEVAQEVVIDSPDNYEKIMEKAGVIVNPDKRIKMINKAFDAIETEYKIKVIRDSELVETVCYLTEKPVGIAGTFSENYLDLPRELLITVMKHHQKFFSSEKSDGTFSNLFIGIGNTDCKDLSVVRKGYERVLAARLADARFFFDEDRKRTLKDFAEKLSGIVYIKGLGTIADKTRRIAEIAVKTARTVCPEKTEQALKAANLCKADLATSMVYEFPELQGIMGREYAKHEGLGDGVALAIEQHYLPRFSGDDLPSSEVARCVALADKIETLTGCFALGIQPTGSEDPFSLRRHALGIIRILLASTPSSNDGLSLTQLVESGLGVLPDNLKGEKEKAKSDLLNFFAGRIKSEFMGQGISYDVVDAVLATGFGNLPDTLNKCGALAEMKKHDYSENLSITFKRVAHIVKGQHRHDGGMDEKLLSEKVETELYDSLLEREKNVAPLLEKKDYAGALKEIAEIRKEVDAFFDGVMVMVDDENLRNNRLGLLRRVTGLFSDLADFSKLVFKEG
ncbi:MAG: glycine--tRNA ligase subunit beta, partial [Nitrospinota bacterium]